MSALLTGLLLTLPTLSLTTHAYHGFTNIGMQFFSLVELYRSPAAVYIKITPVLDTPHSSDAKVELLNLK